MARLKKEKKSNECRISDMKDGDIAQVIKWEWSWGHYNNYVGAGDIIQRWDSHMIVLGKPQHENDCYFFDVLNEFNPEHVDPEDLPNIVVNILKSNSEITI